jgi:hypothetical protein
MEFINMFANFVPYTLIVSYIEIKVKYNVPVYIMSAYVGNRDTVPFINLDTGCM